jgi:replicative superfamily II helicase
VKRKSENIHIDLSVEKNHNFFANKILTHNCNTCATNVIIVGNTRGLSQIDELDILQAAGRCGRLGWSDIGRCYFICDNVSSWQYKINNPRNIISTLINSDILGFHVLAEISNGEVWNRETLRHWFLRSLAAIQLKLEDGFIDQVLADLIKIRMLTLTDTGVFKITSLGKISATLYFYPRDVFHWYMNFMNIYNHNLWSSDLAISYTLGTTPSMQAGYIAAKDIEFVENYSEAVLDTIPQLVSKSITKSTIAADLYDVLTEQEGIHIYSRQLRSDIDRIIGALTWMNGLFGWESSKELTIIALRVKHGVRAGLAELVSLDGIGIVKAKKLDAAGIKTLEDIVENKDKVIQLLGKTLAPKVVTQAKALIKETA